MSPFDRWIADLEARYLADLRFSEVSRALRALSATYVERRGRIQEGAALAGAGKRAAFALFYGPLHFLTVRGIVERLNTSIGTSAILVDLGCGTGASGAAWAAQSKVRSVIAIDRHPWAVAEAGRTYRQFDVQARVIRGDLLSRWPSGGAAFLAAYSINELPDDSRDRLLARLLDRASRGDAVLVIEPLARSAAPWWTAWCAAFSEAGGRADAWRFPSNLPELVAKLDRAAGLDHAEHTARSLWLAPRHIAQLGNLVIE
jgi:hypothetical protein